MTLNNRVAQSSSSLAVGDFGNYQNECAMQDQLPSLRKPHGQRRHPSFRSSISCLLCAVASLISACGNQLGTRPGPLFTVPLEVDGQDAGHAVIDTGGGYELMLRERFGLEVVGEVDVLLFGGRERAALTEAFPYVIGGFPAEANAAFVGLSVCDCNGVGIQFFRKSGVVIVMDFPLLTASFVATVPPGGTTLPFEFRSESSRGFDTAFLNFTVSSGSDDVELLGLLDTGTNATLLRRDLVGEPSMLDPDRSQVLIHHPHMGTVSVNARLFDTPGLPDLILGTDAMGAWADRWYFTYAETGGLVTFFFESPESPAVQLPETNPDLN